MKIKNKSWFLSIGIGVCILLLAIICFVIQKTEKSRGEEADFTNPNELTDIEKRELQYDYLEKVLASMIERVFDVLDCEVDINYSESEIFGADIQFTVPGGSIVNDSMRTTISECISKALEISTDNITISVI